MSSVNKAILVGNLGRDPEIRATQTGKRIASFSVATSERWTDKATGEKKDKTEWHNISVMNDALVSVVERFVRKGSKVYIEGKLQTRKWTDKDGQERYTTEIVLSGYDGQIVLLDKAEQDTSGPVDSYKPRVREGKVTPDVAGDDFEDEIPF